MLKNSQHTIESERKQIGRNESHKSQAVEELTVLTSSCSSFCLL